MKTIIIEPVSNGWFVTATIMSKSQRLFFNRMHDLQDALPDLLADESLIRPPQPVTPGGDRRSETIGGKEFCPSA